MDIPLHPESLRILDDHIAWMRRRRLAAETIKTRHGHVMRFLRWAHQDGRNLVDADSDLIDAYQASLADRSAANERGAISHLRQLYTWALRMEASAEVTKDPTIRADLPRLVRRRPRPIHEDRLALAWRAADDIMRAILALAAMAGLRACEIARLSWADVDLEGEMVVTGKGGHQRVIWIADCTLLVEVLTAIRVKPRGPVIPRADGRAGHNHANALDHRANQFLHGLDIEETLHRLRHRFGTVGYRACTDPIAMMKLMGHADLSATIIYADSAGASAVAAIEATGQIRGVQPTDPDDGIIHLAS